MREKFLDKIFCTTKNALPSFAISSGRIGERTKVLTLSYTTLSSVLMTPFSKLQNFSLIRRKLLLRGGHTPLSFCLYRRENISHHLEKKLLEKVATYNSEKNMSDMGQKRDNPSYYVLCYI